MTKASAQPSSPRPRTRIKICGITNEEDAHHAEVCGADAVGFVFADSPRRISFSRAGRIIRALGPFVVPVGVFVAPSPEELEEAVGRGVRAVQIHGPPDAPMPEPPRHIPVIRALRVHDPESIEAIPRLKPRPAAVLLDAFREGVEGGTGRTFDWNLAVSAVRYTIPVILAGGLAHDNVKEAVRKVRPYGVDASSRLESAPGRKDPDLVARFIRAVREADAAAGRKR
jgi:phosphoribosylanthranilate isomerase